MTAAKATRRLNRRLFRWDQFTATLTDHERRIANTAYKIGRMVGNYERAALEAIDQGDGAPKTDE